MGSSWRCVPSVLVLILCSACPAGDSTGPDAGNDAGEPGDYEDIGPLAACRFGGAGTCGSPESFNLSGCDTASLAGVEPEGIWTTHLRYELADGSLAFGTANITLRRDGGEEWLDRGFKVTRKEVGAGTFYVGYAQSSPDGGTYVRAYAGCRAPASDALVGCMATCRNNRYVAGTFQARKVQRLAGEADAAGLTLVSESPARGTPVDVYVTRQHAYVVSLDGPAGPGGLTVFDVSNPAAPVKTDELTGPEGSNDSYWNGVWAKGDALYVGSGDSGVRVYDITDPAHPQWKDALPRGESINVHTLFVKDNTLYAMAPSGNGQALNQVLVYDVTTPLQPTLLARYVAPGALTTSGAYPHDSFAYEDRLYTFHWGLGLQIADVKNPASPVALGGYRYARSTSHAGAVGRFGDRLIAFEGGEDWGAHLRVLDVTDPAQVVKVGEWRTRPEVSIHNMLLDEELGRLYVAHYQDGVRVLDVREPAHPVEVAHFNTWHPAQAGRGEDFYDGALGIRRPVPPDVAEAGYLYVVDTVRGLLVLHEP